MVCRLGYVEESTAAGCCHRGFLSPVPAIRKPRGFWFLVTSIFFESGPRGVNLLRENTSFEQHSKPSPNTR